MSTESKPAVVLVDDEELVITSLTALLRLETDYDVFGFTDPVKALQHVEANRVDLTISDYLMPGINGVELLTRARQKQPEASRVLLTGHADKQSAIRAINEAGLFQYLEKPWENEQLLLVARSGVERCGLFRELSQKISQLDSAQVHVKDLQRKLIKAFL